MTADLILPAPYAEVVAVATLAVPWGLGTLLGVGLRRWMPRRRHRVLAAGVFSLALGALSALSLVHLLAFGAWDPLLLPALLAGGLLREAARPGAPTGRARLLALGPVLITLALVELGCRVALPPPPYMPPPSEAHLAFVEGRRFHPCDEFYPVNPPPERHRGAAEPSQRVMHVGDSIVQGFGAPIEARFTTLLDAMDPSVQHITRGACGAGPDGYLAMVEHWVPAQRPDLVVVYLFTGNDLHNMDLPWECSNGGPLLAYGPFGAHLRFAHPAWRLSGWRALASSPAPYVTRVFASRSRAAAWLTVLFARASGAIDRLHPVTDRERGEDSPRSWQHLSLSLAAIRDRLSAAHTRLLVVVVPHRETLELALGIPVTVTVHWPERSAALAAHRRFVETARALDLDTLAGWDVVHAACVREGVRPWFLNAIQGDPHFSPAGHALFARWLAAQLAARGFGHPTP